VFIVCSSLQEKVSMNRGFVGCMQSLRVDVGRSVKDYNLRYSTLSSDIADGLDIGKRSLL